MTHFSLSGASEATHLISGPPQLPRLESELVERGHLWRRPGLRPMPSNNASAKNAVSKALFSPSPCPLCSKPLPGRCGRQHICRDPDCSQQVCCDCKSHCEVNEEGCYQVVCASCILSCKDCNVDMCESCSFICNGCDTDCCLACARYCDSCSEPMCAACMAPRCDSCKSLSCKTCLEEDGGCTCHSCSATVCGDPTCAKDMRICESCGLGVCTKCAGSWQPIDTLGQPARSLPHLAATRLPALEKGSLEFFDARGAHQGTLRSGKRGQRLDPIARPHCVAGRPPALSHCIPCAPPPPPPPRDCRGCHCR